MEDAIAHVECMSAPVSGEVQLEILELPPAGDRAWAARAMMGYRRCRDFDTDNFPGQDYAMVRCGGDHIVGVVVDGVGQSFYAEIVTEDVCRCLLEMLWAGRQEPPAKQAMSSALDRLSHALHPKVLAYELPQNLSPLRREADEEKRQHGSQAGLRRLRAQLPPAYGAPLSGRRRERRGLRRRADPHGRQATQARALVQQRKNKPATAAADLQVGDWLPGVLGRPAGEVGGRGVDPAGASGVRRACRAARWER